MQTFAAGSEYPILMAVNSEAVPSSIASVTTANGITTNTADVTKSTVDQSWEVLQGSGAYDSAYRCNLSTFTDRRGTLVELYAYTPISTVVVYANVTGSMTSKWVFNRQYVSQPTLNTTNKKVTFAGRQGTMYYLRGTPALHAGNLTESDPDYLSVSYTGSMNAFGFADGTFMLEGYNTTTQVLSFHDASGTYTLSLASLLSGSNLNRGAAFRLVRTGGPVGASESSQAQVQPARQTQPASAAKWLAAARVGASKATWDRL